MSEMGLNIEPTSLIREHTQPPDQKPIGRNLNMAGPNDEVAAEDLAEYDELTRTTLLGELGAASRKSQADLWDLPGCHKIVTFVVGYTEADQPLGFDKLITTKGQPGVVVLRVDPGSIQNTEEGSEGSSLPEGRYFVEELQLPEEYPDRPPVIE